jgi:hypothetical protein
MQVSACKYKRKYLLAQYFSEIFFRTNYPALKSVFKKLQATGITSYRAALGHEISGIVVGTAKPEVVGFLV